MLWIISPNIRQYQYFDVLLYRYIQNLMKAAVKRILFGGYWNLPSNCGDLVAATSVAGPM